MLQMFPTELNLTEQKEREKTRLCKNKNKMCAGFLTYVVMFFFLFKIKHLCIWHLCFFPICGFFKMRKNSNWIFDKLSTWSDAPSKESIYVPLCMMLSLVHWENNLRVNQKMAGKILFFMFAINCNWNYLKLVNETGLVLPCGRVAAKSTMFVTWIRNGLDCNIMGEEASFLLSHNTYNQWWANKFGRN